jgi:N-acetyl-gamma-glutamyl-phosphate reductase
MERLERKRSFQVIRAGIIGALGYGGGELVRLLSGHPGVELTYLSSELEKPLRMSDVLPNLRGFLDAECEVYDTKTAIERCDVIFVAQHAGWAAKRAREFLDAGLKVIDLSADFRLQSPQEYEKWYGEAHPSPELIKEAVYGLPELYRDRIKQARLVANPGCYPTGAILAMAPLLKERLIDPDTIVVDSKSGVSGAGRMGIKLDFHFPELNEGVKAYAVGEHRHTPEIEQELGRIAGRPVTISFTPHLIPMTRGILTTAYSQLIGAGRSTEQIVRLYRKFYDGEPFVVVLDPGEYPATKSVLTSNFCHIGLKVDERTNRVVVVSAVDNLVKGMSGEAVQNMNLMFGLDEKAGLDRPGVFP